MKHLTNNCDGDNSQSQSDEQSLANQVNLEPETNRSKLLRKFIEQEKSVKLSVRTTFDFGIDQGRILTELKADIPHGEWSKFLRDELGISPRTATNYMRLFNNRDRLAEYLAIKSAADADLTISAAVRYLEKKPTRQPAESLPAAQHAATEPDKDEYTAGDGRVSEPDESGGDAENSDEKNTPKRSMASNSPTRVQPAPAEFLRKDAADESDHDEQSPEVKEQAMAADTSPTNEPSAAIEKNPTDLDEVPPRTSIQEVETLLGKANVRLGRLNLRVKGGEADYDPRLKNLILKVAKSYRMAKDINDNWDTRFPEIVRD